ncbi:TetR/AcrR family transcriptional regulator [Pseudonocardia sp.]|uniref:TetR/AcrR family transcriptional regulator n=1 Tax=Pseudonocardia sp. TaxID=60912 RepID=UPI00260392EB|nr:TetR/AcrR family transcriptional regulator [Pseudonocardia sp.]
MTGTRPPGRPLDIERENAILDAALEVLSEVGYDRLTVTAVHQRAHASAKTVYRRWSGKEELMTAALQRAVTRSEHDPDDVLDTGSLRGDLVANLRASGHATTPQRTQGLLAAAGISGELGALALELLRSQEARQAKIILTRAVERGEIGPDVDPMLVADVTRGLTLQHLLLGSDGLDEDFVDSLVDRVLLPVIRAGRGG